MKKVAVLLVLLVTITYTIALAIEKYNSDLEAQQEKEVVNLSIRVDGSLHSLMDHYFLHADEYGLDLSRFNHLLSIEFRSGEELRALFLQNLAGVTRYNPASDTYRIYLSNDILPLGNRFIEIVLYHELWHVYNHKALHCNSESCLFIFNSVLGPEDIALWNARAMDRYFTELKINNFKTL